MKNLNTAQNRLKAEAALRTMSKKAFDCYSQTSPLEIFEYETEDGTRYGMRGAFNGEDYTLEYIEELFESLADDIAEEEDDD